MKKRILILVCWSMVVAVWGADAAFFEQKEKPQAQATGRPFEEMMNKLTVSLQGWNQLNQDDKLKAVDAVISLYKVRENSAILNSGSFYVKKVDDTLAGDPSVLNMNLPTVMKILSVMEYDFYNGQNKDELARQILGENGYEANKSRRQFQGPQ